MVKLSSQRSRYFVVALAAILFLHSVRGVRDLQIVTPLQCLTIPDTGFDSEEQLSRRQAFLEQFKAEVEAEIQDGGRTENVSGKALSSALFEKASQKVAAQQQSRLKNQQSNTDAQKYQFVGVIQPQDDSSDTAASISWYARPKPKNSRWSMRLIHVNREAVVKHLFDQGKIDVFGRYETTKDSTTGERIVRAKYTAKPRSWRNAWNMHPKRWFTEPSGMYWRERRLREGLYTDGKNVYEATYRYQDGRNGMHLRSTLDEYLNSRSIEEEQKNKVRRQLETSPPDIVLES